LLEANTVPDQYNNNMLIYGCQELYFCKTKSQMKNEIKLRLIFKMKKTQLFIPDRLVFIRNLGCEPNNFRWSPYCSYVTKNEIVNGNRRFSLEYSAQNMLYKAICNNDNQIYNLTFNKLEKRITLQYLLHGKTNY